MTSQPELQKILKGIIHAKEEESLNPRGTGKNFVGGKDE